MFGTGDQVRCFCHVHDVIPALIALLETQDACGRAVNIGSSEQVSVAGLAERVIAATGFQRRDRAQFLPGGLRRRL